MASEMVLLFGRLTAETWLAAETFQIPLMVGDTRRQKCDTDFSAATQSFDKRDTDLLGS